jgi:CRP-like cAMP-binding protein
MRLDRHATIYERDDPAHYCYKVIEGAVRLSRVLADGHRQVLEICVPNDTFGLEPGKTYSATAETIGETVLLRCPRACIMYLNDERPEVRRAMMTMLSSGVCAAHDHLVMLGHQGAKARVASYLLRLFGEDEPSPGPVTLELPVGRQDLADYLGLTIETTCRALSDMKAAKIITTPNRHQVVVRNRSSLEAIAEGEA